MLNWNNNFWYFIRTKIHIIMSVITCIITVILLIVLINIGRPQSEEVKSDIGVGISEYDEEVLLIDETINSYLGEDPYNTSVDEIYKTYEGNKKNINKGLAVTFSYQMNNLHAGIFIKSAELQLSEDSEFTNPLTYAMKESSIDIYALKTNTQYYYRIVVVLSNNDVIGRVSSFTTADTPRILNIDGIVNVRDVGGWKAADGKEIKQGLLYRGSELDGAVEKYYKLSDTGLSEMLDVLKIRSDMDLRNPNVNEEKTDALGSNVKHTYYNATQYAGVFLPEHKESMRKIFSDIADKDNYPIYLHCTHGKDRTGTICAILEALLGVSKEDIKRDYELSAFTYGILDRDWFDDFIEQLDEYEGDSLQESAENYLLSIGVTADEIESIEEIFLG